MSENTITQSDFDSFVSRFGDYLAKANESKKRGNNDYNPLKAVQNPYNEVNMHSGFIYSLLDTNGEHYQDDLFLSLFLEVLGLKEWFGSTTNAQVRKESQNIDLYIFNDTKHIIIENKINAGDQQNQIANYIDKVRNDGAEYENIFVIFLTLHDREPNQSSRTSQDNNLLWEIKQDSKNQSFLNDWFLESKEGEKTNKVGYKKVLYGDKILEWIESCQSKSGVGNIANLNYALESYKDIVQIITGKKESAMDIVDFFKEAEDFEVAFEIMKNSKQIKNAYFDRELQKLRDEPQFKGYEILSKDELNTKYGHHIFCNNYGDIVKVIFNKDIEKQTFKIAFCIEDATGNASKCGATKLIVALLVKTNNAKLQNQNLPTRLFELTDSKDFFKSHKDEKNGFWSWNDIWDNIETYKATKFFKEYLGGVNEVNKRLRELESNVDSEIAKLAKEVKDYQMDS